MDTEFKEEKKGIIPSIIIIILILAIGGLLLFKPDLIGLNNNTPVSNTVKKDDDDDKDIELLNIYFQETEKEIKVNDSFNIKVVYSPSNATNKKLTWTSSNSSVVTVNESGTVTAKTEGEATISATSYNNKTAAIKIKVSKNTIDVTTIIINNGDSKVDVGKTLQLTATIKPTDATNKNITWTSSDASIATVSDSGLVKGVKAGNVTITAKSINGKTSSVKVTVNKVTKKNYAEIYFLNVYDKPTILESLKDDPDNPNGYSNGESFIIKTYDKKYILIDTGHKNEPTKNYIYEELKRLQKTDKVKIDYMILTHSHGDHVGNAVSLIKDDNIQVDKVIIKNESKSQTAYKNISKAISGEGKVVKIKEDGQTSTLGKYVEIMLFNTSDVYKDKECHKGYHIAYYADTSKAKKINNKYYYFDGVDYPNIKMKSTTELKKKHDKFVYGLDNYFYVSISSNTSSDCNPNSNSLAIIIKVKTDKGNRYMYLPGDLDNGGYDIVPINGIYGNNGTRLYDNENIKYDSKNNRFTGIITDLNEIASETNAAKSIKAKLGNDVKNITILQSSHHGINTSPDAINILGLNNASVNVIIPVKSDTSKSKAFNQVRTYYYTLSKAKKFYPGGSTKNGIHCAINNTGSTACKEY